MKNNSSWWKNPEILIFKVEKFVAVDRRLRELGQFEKTYCSVELRIKAERSYEVVEIWSVKILFYSNEYRIERIELNSW